MSKKKGNTQPKQDKTDSGLSAADKAGAIDPCWATDAVCKASGNADNNAEDNAEDNSNALVMMALLNPKRAEEFIAGRALALSQDDLRAAYRRQFKDTENQPPKYMARRLAKFAVNNIRSQAASAA